jgi:hypothetical protein
MGAPGRKSMKLAMLRWFKRLEYVTAICLPNSRKSPNTNELNGLRYVRIRQEKLTLWKSLARWEAFSRAFPARQSKW